MTNQVLMQASITGSQRTEQHYSDGENESSEIGEVLVNVPVTGQF
jgi:hypothetical protein